jgi:hypothetical protein
MYELTKDDIEVLKTYFHNNELWFQHSNDDLIIEKYFTIGPKRRTGYYKGTITFKGLWALFLIKKQIIK